MKSRIRCNKQTHKKLKEFQNTNESLEETINRLLDLVGEEMLNEEVFLGYTNIKLSEETKERIKSYSNKPSESYESILDRALSLSTKQ